MYHLSCGEIWGGIHNCDDDVASAGLLLRFIRSPVMEARVEIFTI